MTTFTFPPFKVTSLPLPKTVPNIFAVVQATAQNAAQPQATQKIFNQAYQVQAYNADGQIVTQTVSLSSLQGTKQSFDPNAVVSSLPPTVANSEARLIQSVNPAANINAILQTAAKIDAFLCLKSMRSPIVEYNHIKTPQMAATLNYNFFIPNETDVTSQEDPAQDPFVINQPVPRYVQLNWMPVSVSARSTDFASRTTEEKKNVQNFLANHRGNANAAGKQIANSFQSLKRAVNPVNRDGKALQLTDTHDLITAFNSFSNSKLFKNSMVVLNTSVVDADQVNLNDLFLDDLTDG